MFKHHPDPYTQNLEQLVERLPFKAVTKDEALAALGADPKALSNIWFTGQILQMESAGLVKLHHGFGVERIKNPPPKPEPKSNTWNIGDPLPQVLTGIPTPDGGWIEVPEDKIEATKAKFAPIYREQRLARLKHELSELGIDAASRS
jgi:hypothetical protein